jgi:SAM-dependent methyltransferase
MKNNGGIEEVDAPLARYDVLAEEYYDERRHPTCANFREASARILESWLERFPIDQDGLSFEVGAGDSLLAELLARRGSRLQGLIATDQSPSMLRHSEKWKGTGLQLLVSEADELPLADGSLNLLVSSLGDPYNTPAFWREASRALRPGGRVLFTTPSHEWATSYRAGQAQEATTAEFVLSDGRTVLVPSWVYSTAEQVRLIKCNDLAVVEIVHVSRSSLVAKRLSPKLLVGNGHDLSIVSGYFVVKGRRS